jgi:predicted 2-oxoglutarate/Fe(II)-dependent dioxygenase YbiX
MFFVNSFIKVCKNTLSSEQCKFLLEQLNAHPVDSLDPVTGKLIWDKARVYNRNENDELLVEVSDRRTCSKMSNESAIYGSIYQIIEPLISKQIYDYIDHFEVELSKEQDNRYGILRYEAGQASLLHSDDGVGVHRRVSCILYINDDYTGGELFFNKQDYEIKPDAGDLIIFPSAFPYTHEAREVKTGVKYCVVKFWA